MTREECSQKIAKKLWEIIDIMQEFYPEWEGDDMPPLCIACAPSQVSAFLILDKQKHVINFCQFDEDKNKISEFTNPENFC